MIAKLFSIFLPRPHISRRDRRMLELACMSNQDLVALDRLDTKVGTTSKV